jgi:N-acetylglucosaminyl-diphospho-decaprenol L-rhamnosyltransferase
MGLHTMPDAPLLEIVVVTSTGARDVVRTCLTSLRAHPLKAGPMVVHVVDNASADGTPAMIRDEFPEVVLHELGWNSGFCIANNLVLRQAEAPFVLLLNPDTEVYDGVLDHMVDVMRSRPEVGMSSCRLVRPDGTFDHASKRSFPTPVGALAHFLRIGRLERAPRWLAQYRAPELGEFEAGEVDAVNGAFMLVRQEALREVGLLDEGYWLYMDDLDWCFRFRQRGWSVWYDGAVSTMHVKGGVTKKSRHRRLRTNVAFHRSMARYYRKFHAGRPPVDVAIYAAIYIKLVISVVRSAIVRRSLT